MIIHNTDRTLALAGIVQAAALVNHIARGRWVDQHIVDICTESIFVENPQSVLSVYGDDINNLQFGLRRITTFFPKPDKRNDAELANYLFGSILLSRLLMNDNERMNKLGAAIDAVNTQRHDNKEMTKEDVQAQLAQLYVDYISSFKRRINVLGNRDILTQPLEVNSIRTLLLAAVRASILWNQVGGRLWHLWWKRRRLVDLSHELLS